MGLKSRILGENHDFCVFLQFSADLTGLYGPAREFFLQNHQMYSLGTCTCTCRKNLSQFGDPHFYHPLLIKGGGIHLPPPSHARFGENQPIPFRAETLERKVLTASTIRNNVFVYNCVDRKDKSNSDDERE
jgi:hypothetical protein